MQLILSINFYSMGLVDGDEIYWKRRPEYKATICGANELKYKGEVYSPSKLLWEIWKKETNDTTVVGTPYDEFKFNDDHNCLSHRWFSMNKQDND